VPGAENFFVRDLVRKTTTLVSINKGRRNSGAGKSYGPEISADSRFLSFMSLADDFVDTDTNGTFDIFLEDLR
jgi:hypothetical protein